MERHTYKKQTLGIAAVLAVGLIGCGEIDTHTAEPEPVLDGSGATIGYYDAVANELALYAAPEELSALFDGADLLGIFDPATGTLMDAATDPRTNSSARVAPLSFDLTGMTLSVEASSGSSFLIGIGVSPEVASSSRRYKPRAGHCSGCTTAELCQCYGTSDCWYSWFWACTQNCLCVPNPDLE